MATLRCQDSVRNYACRVSLLDETGFYAPSMAHNALPSRPWLGISVLRGHNSTVSRQLRYSPSRACVCLLPGFLTLWLYLPSCRFAHGYCRGLALCMFVICVCFARSPPGSLWICSLFARFCSGLAQHHIECHHEAEAHHKCYGGAV